MTPDTSALPASVPVALRGARNGLWPTTAIPMTMNLVPVARPALAPRQVDSRRAEYQGIAALGLEPGRHEIRAALEDETLGSAGSVYGYVVIPHFRRQAVSLSGIARYVTPESPGTPLGSLASVLPVIPSARRLFSRADDVRGCVLVYQGLSRPATPGYLTTESRNDQDRMVYRSETRVTLDSMGAGRAMDIELEVPVERLRRGPYLLTVETRDGNETARRDVPVEVESGQP